MALKLKYKNKTDQELVIINVGVVAANGIIEVDHPIENPNLELIIEKTK